jgi:ABC-2 type transport system permease protein|nr:MAG: ABC transporter [Thermoproteus sp. AZ2]
MRRLLVALSRAYAFITIRGYKVWASYRTQVALNVVNWVIPLFIYYFMGVAFHLLKYTPDYLGFITVGIAFQGYFSSAITTLAGRIRNEELIGTLEYYIAAPLSPLSLMAYSSLWGLAINAVPTALTLAVGAALGVRFAVDPLSAAAVLALYIASSLGLNLIAGAVVLIVKQGNPVALFASVASNLLGGTVFPVSALPPWLRYVSYALPLTWGLDGLRAAMLSAAPIPAIAQYIAPLAALAAAYLGVGVALTRYAYYKIMREGTVAMY